MSLYYTDDQITLHHGDALDVARTLPNGSVDCIVTSPPYYGLRDYGNDGQYGLEESPAAYVETMRALFSELRRVLADDGTLWLNIGDSYSGSGGSGNTNKRLAGKTKTNIRNRSNAPQNGGMAPRNLMGIPWAVATALRDSGWFLRQEIIWAKPNGLPTNAPDRYEARTESVFLLSKSSHYWFSPYARNDGHSNLWMIPTESLPGSHVAVMPQELARRAIVAGCKPGGTVMDPFSGSGTTGLVAQNNGRRYVGIDISADYLKLSLETRLQNGALDIAI